MIDFHFRDAVAEKMASVTSQSNLKIIDTFIEAFVEILGVFEPTYEGGDFCVGVTLGFNGINMLEKVA